MDVYVRTASGGLRPQSQLVVGDQDSNRVGDQDAMHHAMSVLMNSAPYRIPNSILRGARSSQLRGCFIKQI
jgi:hypothetical protein